MLSHLRLVPSSFLRAAPKCTPTVKHNPLVLVHNRARFISSSLPRCSDLGPEPPTPEDDLQMAALERDLKELQETQMKQLEEEGHKVVDAEDEAGSDPNRLSGIKNDGLMTEAVRALSYEEWLNHPLLGERFKKHGPRKWLGNNTPFPMNSTFKPPPPLSDRIRQQIFKEYMEDPVNNSVRMLSRKYHLSLSRIDAILRLKGLENDWIKEKKELQTGFEHGMEYMLDVVHQSSMAEFAQKRYDVNEADFSQEDPEIEKLRLRYRRMYWETQSEAGEEPVLPRVIEEGEEMSKKFDSVSDMVYKNYTLVPRIPDIEYMKRPKSRIVVRETAGRPTMKFVDVGAKFMDVEERVRRIKMSKTRSARKLKKVVA
ncbi:eukaryotic mitochondrial regulator protein-domain-containing protein [Cyathus striatus]|nr:eukaryotic mitochondrial regulator protein-domain-containing protein [Cyathus striatus]